MDTKISTKVSPARKPLVLVCSVLLLGGIVGCATNGPVESELQSTAPAVVGTTSSGPEQFRLGDADQTFEVQPPADLNTIAVPAQVTEQLPIYAEPTTAASPLSQKQFQGLYVNDIPKPMIRGPKPTGGVKPATKKIPGNLDEPAPLAPAASNTFDSLTTDDNVANTGGSLFIPADPYGAAGPDHLVSVTNVSIQFHTKAGTPLLDSIAGSPITGISLASFFSALSPVNLTFDPKVIYDQYAERFLVVTLELVDNSLVDPLQVSSRILLAVSDDADPAGTWYLAAFNSRLTVNGTTSWADYPGFAVDEEAVYITANMFGFNSTGGAFNGNRIWILEKTDGLGGGFYDGGAVTGGVYDPIPVGALTGTQQPAHIFGVAPTSPNNVGTWLTMFSGLSDGTLDYLQVIRIDNPVGPGVTTFVGPNFISLGDIDDLDGTSLLNAPMPDTSDELETNDRRTYDAVWRNDMLYATTSFRPKAGDPEAGQTTALWAQMDTDPGVSLFDQGRIGGEELAVGTHTFFAAIAVNDSDDVAIGFSAAAETIYPSSAYTTRRANDAMGSTTAPEILRSGLDYYIRTFDSAPCSASPASNRWGDYSAMTVDPVDQCFWAFNKHAISRGTATTGGCNGRPALEDGRWGSAFGYFCESCATQLELSPQTISGSESFQARDFIALSALTVASTGDLSITAGSANFDSGFNVQNGGILNVDIGACD